MEVIISDPADYFILSNWDHPASELISIYHIPFDVLQNYTDQSELVNFNSEAVNQIRYNEVDKEKISDLHFTIGACSTLLDCSVIYSAQVYNHCIVTSQKLMYNIASECNLNVVMTSDFCNHFKHTNQSNLRIDMFKKISIKTKDLK